LLEPERPTLGSLRTVISIDGGGDQQFEELLAPGAPIPETGRAPEDLASILYTSGTTGKPKGATLTHGNLLTNVAQIAELVPLAAGEAVGMILPLFHANAQVVTTLVPLMIGCEVVMWERFSASTFWETVDRYRPVTISAVPTILAGILDAPGAPQRPQDTSLRYVICGAAPLPIELLQAFQTKFGIRILEGYGLTETSCVASVNPYYGERKVGSIGLPVRGQQMRIVDENGAPVAPGGYGEITIKGPNVMPGYLRNPQANAESLRDGWLYTGDIGYMDDDGYFFIVDRTKDMIIRGGENIYPREIEEVLYAYRGVQECAVIGVPDEFRGEEVLAVVVPSTDDFDLAGLETFAAERLAKYKLPRGFVLRDSLPKTPTGKISKAPLRDEFGSWADDRVKTPG
jgi:acyl-CoA synthetase (AMP-forming)/AMP-acid ligase II